MEIGKLRGMKYARSAFTCLALVAAVGAGACSGSKNNSGFGPDGNGNGTGDGGSPGAFGTGGDGGSTGPCVPAPGNYDFPGNGCDDDADGTVDNPAVCDDGLPANGDASAFVQALGVCQMADDTHWGLVSASYTNGFGTSSAPEATQHSILSKFGSVVVPQEGKSLGVISTGYANEYDNADNSSSPALLGEFKANSATYGEGGALPAGFPKAAGSCPIASDVHDVMDVKLQLKVPNNAKGISFDFDFWSGEWPDFVCSKFNDGFIAYLTSTAFNGGAPDNISFDSKNNPVSVNNGFFDRCTAGVELGCDSCKNAAGQPATCPSIGTSECPGGTSELAGTGFANPTGKYSQDCNDNSTATSSSGGATGWLTTQAPVAPGETITIEFMIWNTGDENYDSSILLDHLTWVPGTVTTGTNRPR